MIAYFLTEGLFYQKMFTNQYDTILTYSLAICMLAEGCGNECF